MSSTYVNIGGAPDLNELELNLDDANDDIATLQLEMDDVESDVATLQTDLNTAEATIVTHTANISTNATNIIQGAILDPTNNSGGWFTFFDDLMYTSIGSSGVGVLGVRNVNAGSISVKSPVSTDTNRVGLMSLNTSTTNNTLVSVQGSTSLLQLGDSQHVFHNSGYVSVAPTAGEDFRVGIGLMSAAAQTPTHAVYFTMDRAVSATNWVASCIKNTSVTTVDTGVAFNISTYQSFRIEINSAATSCTFYINGSLVATITTNIPNANGQYVSPALYARKIAGTLTSLSYHTDYLYWRYKLITSRGTF